MQNAFFLIFPVKIFGHVKKKQYFCTRFRPEGSNESIVIASIAQLVEH